MPRSLSIVIPALNEAEALPRLLDDLAAARRRGAEIVVADGGSTDGTVDAVSERVDRVVEGARGRAEQLAAGVSAATGEVIWLLHADSRVDPASDLHIVWEMEHSGRPWGRFNVRLDGNHPLLRVVETAMNVRSRLTGIATGDQGIFVRRDVLERAGGIPQQPLMEDVELSKRLKRIAPPLCLLHRIVTSARRWESRGILRTVAQMWWLRLVYYLGAHPENLHRRYYGE